MMLDVQPADIPMQGFIDRSSVPANVFRPTVSNALDGLELNFIVTDSIRFKFDRQVKRKIPLAVDTTRLGLNANYILVKPISITPAEVEFEGPASVLDSFPNPFLLKLPNTTLTKSFKSSVPSTYSYETLVKSDIVEADITIEVKPLTWQNLSLAPSVLNPPEKGQLLLLPPLVNIRYGFVAGPAPMLLDPLQFSVAVDLNQLNSKDSTVAVQVRSRPTAVERVQILPNRLKVRYTTK
jgi:hypothetical protein